MIVIVKIHKLLLEIGLIVSSCWDQDYSIMTNVYQTSAHQDKAMTYACFTSLRSFTVRDAANGLHLGLCSNFPHSEIYSFCHIQWQL